MAMVVVAERMKRGGCLSSLLSLSSFSNADRSLALASAWRGAGGEGGGGGGRACGVLRVWVVCVGAERERGRRRRRGGASDERAAAADGARRLRAGTGDDEDSSSRRDAWGPPSGHALQEKEREQSRGLLLYDTKRIKKAGWLVGFRAGARRGRGRASLAAAAAPVVGFLFLLKP
jgi:hypothetical protein